MENPESKNFFQRLKWQDYFFVAVLILALIINYNIISPLKALPSPLYGGDMYNHLGSMEDLSEGGSIFQSGQLVGEIQWVPWLYHVLVVGFSKLTGLDMIHAVLNFSYLVLAASLLVIYLFVSKFFANKDFGLLAVLFVIPFSPIFKYSHFSLTLMIPLFFFSIYMFMKKKNWLSAILCGIAYGLTGLSNTHAFILPSVFIFFMGIYYILIKPISRHEHGWKFNKKIFLDHLLKVGAIFIIGFAIALIWWYKPIFVYHGNTINDMQIYGFPELVTFPEMTSLVWQSIVDHFFAFSSPLEFIIIGIGALLGIILLFMVKDKKTEHHFLILILVSSFAGLLSHFLTIPIFHTNIAPGLLFDAFLRIMIIFYFIFFLTVVFHYADRYSKYIRIGVLALLGIIFILYINDHVQSINTDQWYTQARSELPSYLSEDSNWIMTNTNRSDVFLAGNEDSFALNALSARKVVTYRRTHASTYTDMNQRMLDAGLMLYSNNDTVREELFKKYDVKYLYWTVRWFDNEFQVNDQGQLTGFFDPLSIEYTAQREQVLKENNVTYIRTTYYLDPAWSPTFPKRDLLIILPSRFNLADPWSTEMDKHLQLLKETKYDNQLASRIYKVN